MLSRKAGTNIFAISGSFRPCASTVRKLATGWRLFRTFNYPLTPDDMPRAAGFPTMFRLPSQSNADGLDACFMGIPMDNGTFTHRIGAR